MIVIFLEINRNTVYYYTSIFYFYIIKVVSSKAIVRNRVSSEKIHLKSECTYFCFNETVMSYAQSFSLQSNVM